MSQMRILVAVAATLLIVGLDIGAGYAGEAQPPFASSAGALPRAPGAAPNPPYIAISRSGSNAARLDWDHPDASLTSYEVWRAEQPYFDPAQGQGSKIGSYSFSEGIYAEFAPFSYVDNGSCGYFIAAGQQLPCAPQNPAATVVGDPLHQYFWVVRAGNSEYADSNRVGEFDFSLEKGS
jgi:hypothetical protein